MTRRTARTIEGLLSATAAILLFSGGWGVVAFVALMVPVAYMEVRWSDRWPFSRSSR